MNLRGRPRAGLRKLLSDRHPDFSATIRIVGGTGGGPDPDSFGFPESGERNVPMGMIGLEGIHSVQIRFKPNAVVQKGESVHVDCALSVPELFAGLIQEGASFELCSPAKFAEGIITSVSQVSG